jgi:hypothetical protein
MSRLLLTRSIVAKFAVFRLDSTSSGDSLEELEENRPPDNFLEAAASGIAPMTSLRGKAPHALALEFASPSQALTGLSARALGLRAPIASRAGACVWSQRDRLLRSTC